MEHRIIYTGAYLLIVDDSEIKEGDFFMTDDNRIELYAPDWRAREWHKKIIAHLPLNSSPILEGVDLLPPIEDEVEKLAKEYGELICNKDGTARFDFKRGYNKAKEKYKYTEEDIMKAVVFGYRQNGRNGHIDNEEEREFIQSLQQPKMPVGFECEMEDVKTLKNRAGGVTYFGKPKTTTNSQGLTQWVGEYIY